MTTDEAIRMDQTTDILVYLVMLTFLCKIPTFLFSVCSVQHSLNGIQHMKVRMNESPVMKFSFDIGEKLQKLFVTSFLLFFLLSPTEVAAYSLDNVAVLAGFILHF